MGSVATIISYCTNDYRFLAKCIEEARIFSKQILIPVCDHFFDGTPENRSLLNHTYAEHPDCQFIEFAYRPNQIYSQYHSLEPDDPDGSIYWAASARYIGFHYVDPDIETILFLDSDEIAEGGRFLAWLESGEHLSYEALRLGAYYYALRATLQAKNVVNLPLLVRKGTFAPLTLFNEIERIGAYMSHPGPKREEVLGLDGLPLFHHYSWVRTKEECLWKARTWSHLHDEDWPLLIEEAFSGATGRLFGSTHAFREIKQAYFDPLAVPFPEGPAPQADVLRITHRDLIRKEIEYALL